MATVTGTRRLLDISGNNISTAVSLEAEGTLLDSNGQSGTSNQVLISTATGIDWVDGSGSSIIGGPYLPLSAGVSYPLTGDLFIAGIIRNSSGDLEIRNQTASGFATATKLKQQTVNGLETFLTLDGTSRNAYFTNQGNVGIGTTSPSNKLTIGQAADENGLKILGYDDESGSSISLSVSSAGHARLSQTTDGSSGYLFLQAENYLQLIAGSFIYTTSTFRVYDNTQLQFGNSGDYKIYHSTSADTLYIHTDDNKGITVDNAGNVGIGTTSPDALLHVRAATDVTGTIEVQGGKATVTSIGEVNAELNFGSNDSSATGGIGGSIKSITEASNGAYVGMGFYTTRQSRDPVLKEAMRIANDGNVGIGTTSPLAKFNVQTGTSIGWNLLANANILSGTTTTGIGIDTNEIASRGGHLYIGTIESGDDFIFRAGGVSTRMVISGTTGNVGIGTTSPSQKLHISGNMRLTGAFRDRLNSQGAANYVLTSTGSNGTQWVDASSSSIIGGPYLPLAGGTMTGAIAMSNTNITGINNIQANADVSIQTGAGEYALYGANNAQTALYHNGVKKFETSSVGISVIGNIDLPSNGAILFDNTNNIEQYYIRNGGGSQSSFQIGKGNPGSDIKLVIDDNGNVGIGTTSPGVKLDVNGQIRSNNEFLLQTGTTAIGSIRNQAGALDIRGDSTRDVSLGSVTSPQALFIEGSNGNVGIGTTSPQEKLDISAGNIRLYDNQRISWSSSNSNIGRVRITGNESNDFISFATDNSDRVRINNTGVGIGTTSPTNKLHIQGSQTTVYSSTDTGGQASVGTTINNTNTAGNTNNFSQLLFTVGTNNNSVSRIVAIRSGSDASDLAFVGKSAAGVAEYMRIKSGGNVGIGTASPARRLEVYESSSSLVGQFRSGSGTSSFISFANTGSTADQVRIGSISSSLVLSTNFTERMRISSGGNVGIGIGSPSQKLDVNGVVKSSRFFVGTNESADQWAIQVRNNAGTADSGIYFNNNSSEIYLRNSSNVVGARIRSNSTSYFNGGNVGIGTNSPGSSLEVLKSASSTTISEARISSLVTSGYGGQANLWLRTSTYGNAMVAFGPQVGSSTVASSASGKISYSAFNRIFTVTADSNALLTLGGSNDRVGINQTSPQYTLDVTGNGRFTSTVTATNFINSSDERLKENIEEVCDNNVEVNWKTFNFKTEKEQKRYGVIAQELEKTNPEFVREDSQGFKSVAYIDLLVAKIAELEARIQKLENK